MWDCRWRSCSTRRGSGCWGSTSTPSRWPPFRAASRSSSTSVRSGWQPPSRRESTRSPLTSTGCGSATRSSSAFPPHSARTGSRTTRTSTTRSGLSCPGDFLLAFSPEREDPGRKDFNTRTIPKLVGGVNPSSTEVAAELYGACLERVIPVSHARVAESAKLLENIFRSVNIALVNELKMILDRMGIDVWEVVRAAATKPFGFMPFFPGPGLGGHCIPLDPFYLSWKAAEHGVWARFIELAGEINSRMPRYVIEKVALALNGDRKAINGSRVLVLGLAYKANVDDDRESPSYEILELLLEAGAQIDYCDPWFPKTHRTRKHDLGLRSVPCDAATFSQYDALVVSTAHDVFRKAELYRGTRLVVDTRNLMAPLFPDGGGPRVVKA